ncbi:MAG: hypothetical protein CVU42_06015 [Chloroflexi bacterium HGW-Chloroflexi-4]|jgi:hypothetical protein|nr:MAG: hypothetical protein CVU42_06015 [Chloroflexi bacterium HGW-Chloroflexi-4]
MKTNVIQLEAHDDVISIKDKMAWQSCQRMILVWPKKGRILHNELELVLLNREANSLGSELALVTHHPVISEWALDSNVPLFASISAAERSAWKADTKGSIANKVPKGVDANKAIRAQLPRQASSKPETPLTKGLALVISLGALIALLVVLLPHAEITYFPVTSLQEVEIRIKASEVFSGINPSGGIPAKAVFIDVNGEKAMPSTGKVSIPTTKAVGEVIFTNLTFSDVTLPTGTLLLAGDQTLTSFSLTEAVVVPAGVIDSAAGKVEALITGTEGNLAANSVWTLPGGMYALVSVSNPEKFSGGGGVETPSPSAEDYALLERQLLEDLMIQGLASLQAEKVEGLVYIEPSLTLEKILLSEQVNKIDEPADEAILRLNVRLKIFGYQQSDLNAIADLVLTSNQPQGFVPVKDSITLNRVGDFRVDDFGQAAWTMKASRLLVPEWNMEQASANLAGMKVNQAQSLFSNIFAQRSPAVIESWFSKWPWMPFLSTNISFASGDVQ